MKMGHVLKAAKIVYYIIVNITENVMIIARKDYCMKEVIYLIIYVNVN